MDSPEGQGKKNIGRNIAVYLGSAWVFIEAFNFLISKYNLEATYLDIIILLVLFGLPATVIHNWFGQKFTRKAIALHAINALVALSVISYHIVNPNQLKPTEIRLLKFAETKKKLAQSVNSIAVLPFSNLTGDSTQNYLELALQDELSGELGGLGLIRVIGTTSTLPFKFKGESLSQIANVLNVDAIVEGSILPSTD